MIDFSLFNKEALTLLILVCLSIQYVTEDQTFKKLQQDGCPIEDYVEKFLNISYKVLWKERTLKTIFWGELAVHIYQQMPASDTICSLERYIEYALWLSGSSFTVGEVADCPVDKTKSHVSYPCCKGFQYSNLHFHISSGKEGYF